MCDLFHEKKKYMGVSETQKRFDLNMQMLFMLRIAKKKGGGN